MKIANHKKTTSCFKLLAILAAFFLAGATSWGSIPADKVSVSTPVYIPNLSEFAPKLGKYTYKVSWQGIPAGTVELDLARKGADYNITAYASTARFIDVFYKLRYRAEALISADTLLPRRTVSFSRENDSSKEKRLNFLPDGTVHSMVKDDDGDEKLTELKSDNFTLDPFSVAFMALCLEWRVGVSRQFDAFNGSSRYLIELTAKERTSVTVDGRPREAIVLVPTVQKLTDPDSKKKLKNAKIYISAGSQRELLKITSNLFVGSVNTEMVEFSSDSRG